MPLPRNQHLKGPAAGSLFAPLRGTRGAVYVEFLIAFMPTFFLYFGLCEIGLIYTAKLQVTRATTTALRAAIVVLPDHPKYYTNGDTIIEVNKYEGRRKELIEAAAMIPLLATQKPWRVKVELETDTAEIKGDSKITVRVRYMHRCIMPIVRHIACSPPSGLAADIFNSFASPEVDAYFAELTDSATLTNHGANYSYEELDKTKK